MGYPERGRVSIFTHRRDDSNPTQFLWTGARGVLWAVHPTSREGRRGGGTFKCISEQEIQRKKGVDCPVLLTEWNQIPFFAEEDYFPHAGREERFSLKITLKLRGEGRGSAASLEKKKKGGGRKGERNKRPDNCPGQGSSQKRGGRNGSKRLLAAGGKGRDTQQRD